MKIYEYKESNYYNDFVNVWIKYHKVFVKESTYANYRQVIDNKMLPFFKNIKIGELNKKMIQQFIIENDNVSTKSIKDYVIVIKQSLNYLFDNDIITEFSIQRLKYKKQAKTKIKFLNEEDYNLVKQYCISEFNITKDINGELGILIALNTGMRIGEICGLKMKDINFDKRTISVKRTLQRIYTKSEKTKVLIGTPKSNASVREIPLTKVLFDFMSQLENKPENFVIRGEKYAEPRLLRKHFNYIMSTLQLEHIKFHALRHTFATLGILNKIDIKTISELLGHANAKMTLDIYAHTTIKQKRSAIELIGNL